MRTKMARLCMCIALALIACAGLRLVFLDDTDSLEEALAIEELECDLGPEPLGTPIVEIRVRNRSDQTHEILGMDKG